MSTLLDVSFGGNFLTRYLTNRFSNYLPRRFKRLLFVSSAMGLLLKTRYPDLDMVSKINDKLKLAYSAMGLLFPIYIGSFIWKNLRNNTIHLEGGLVNLDELDLANMEDSDCWKTGVFFAQNTPSWLQYGSDGLLTADVHDMMVALKAA